MKPTKSSYKAKTKPNSTSSPAKPRSKLQQVQAQANWAVHFKLQPFGTNLVSKLITSPDTKRMVDEYNRLTKRLKLAIQVDAIHTKRCIKAREAEREAKAKAELEAWNKLVDKINPPL